MIQTWSKECCSTFTPSSTQTASTVKLLAFSKERFKRMSSTIAIHWRGRSSVPRNGGLDMSLCTRSQTNMFCHSSKLVRAMKSSCSWTKSIENMEGWHHLLNELHQMSRRDE